MGTAALTRSAPIIGTALGHLAEVVAQLGYLHELPQDSRAAERTLYLPGVQAWLQKYLDTTRDTLATATHGLRKHAAQRPRTSTPSAALPAPPHQTNPAPDPKRRNP